MRTSPDYIQLYPTMGCNLSCGFCFNKGMRQAEDMGLDDYRRMLDVLSRLGVKTIDMMGGEPTLHSHIVEIARLTADAGLHINLSSNGTNLSVLEEMRTIHGMTIGLSINDRKRLANTAGFITQYNLVVKTVYTRGMNMGLVEDILMLRPGRFYLIYKDALSPEDLKTAASFRDYMAVSNSISSKIGRVYCSGFLPDTEKYPELSEARCPAGVTKLGIMPDGSVYPCNLFFGVERFRLGNILTDPFDSIWHSRKLDFFRRFRGNTCRITCMFSARCHGGCPAHALFLRGDISAPDPRCAITENIFGPSRIMVQIIISDKAWQGMPP